MSLRNAMDAAREAASQVPATTDGPSNDVAPVQYGTSLDSFLSGGMQVDSWIQVKDAGIRLNREDKAFIEEFDAELDLDTVQLFVGLRAEFAGNKVEYRKSIDGGKTTTLGESFAQIQAQWKETSLKPVSPYRGADMTLVLTDDVVQGKVTIPAGTKLGYTTPVTGFAPFQQLLKKLAAEGRVQDVGGGRLSGGTVKVRCTHDPRINAAKQEYGVMLMELAD